jgi:hypothetical protein
MALEYPLIRGDASFVGIVEEDQIAQKRRMKERRGLQKTKKLLELLMPITQRPTWQLASFRYCTEWRI